MSDKFIVIDLDGTGWGEVMECDSEIEAIEEMEEWKAKHKHSQADVMMKCRYCLDWYEIGKKCGCKESRDEAEQLLIDNAAEAKSERQRGH